VGIISARVRKTRKGAVCLTKMKKKVRPIIGRDRVQKEHRGRRGGGGASLLGRKVATELYR